MKSLIILVIFFLFTSFLSKTSAQFDLGEKIKNKIEKKAEKKVDKTIDKGIDEAVDAVKNSGGEDKTDKGNNAASPETGVEITSEWNL